MTAPTTPMMAAADNAAAATRSTNWSVAESWLDRLLLVTLVPISGTPDLSSELERDLLNHLLDTFRPAFAKPQ